ncbi:MAG: 3-hydroxyanthranilate 3,4-dioxygenase [Proteobacteria bacterium]|nr:3-hydroxyanthranilate 3,4-dioxygenase [Pseudomonadota bacterium]
MSDLQPFNLMKWIDDNSALLRPPVGNAQVLPEGDFIVMALGGPNVRTDFHDDPGEEIFYQVKGDIVLRVMEDDGPKDVHIREGEMYMIAAHKRHSPQRPADSVGIVVERKRHDGELDAFEWYCEKCNALVHRSELLLRDIYKDLPPVFEAYYGDAGARQCPDCGHQNPGKPTS